MAEYRKQMEKGDIKHAYQGLMEYIMGLRTLFAKIYPDYVVSGSIYYGYMDMTYFSFFPKALKLRQLKVAIVFLHDTFKFEAWLAGSNKRIQTQYWKLFKDISRDGFRVPSTIEGVDSIVESVLVENPDFGDLNTLTKQIEKGTLRFIQDVETVLSERRDV
jgi:hypothetical protein